MRNNLKKFMAAVLGTTMILAGCATPAATTTAGSSAGAATTAAAKAKYKVGILQFVQHGALDDANRGFVDGLAKAGFKDGDNVTIDQMNAQGDQANLKNIADKFVNDKVDLILAIATQAAQSAANATKDIPVLATAITDFVAAKLVQSNEKPGGNVTGTTDMASTKAQMEAMMKLLPNVKTVGLMYTSSEVNSQVQADAAKVILAEMGVTVKEVTISTVNDIQEAAQSLMGKVDAIYVPTDNIISSAMPTLAKVTEANNIPVMVGAETMVNDGGIMSLAVDYYAIGFQTGTMAGKILKGEAKPADIPVEAQKEYTLVINKGVADKLGITISEELLKTAKLINE